MRIDDSAWAPLFSAVVEPNRFTATVEQAKQREVLGSLEEFWDQFDSADVRSAAQAVLSGWLAGGQRRRLGPNHVVLYAPGPSKDGFRTVVAVYSDGRVMVPFGAYAGQNSSIPIEALITPAFRAKADGLFGFKGSEKLARTAPGWLTADRVDRLLQFCFSVADAYKANLEVPRSS